MSDCPDLVNFTSAPVTNPVPVIVFKNISPVLVPDVGSIEVTVGVWINIPP